MCGYVYDEDTQEPIKNAFVELNWRKGENTMWNSTRTNEDGFYLIRVASGSIKLDFYANGYFSESTGVINVSEKEKIWKNISLTPLPKENSKICGYIRDNLTGKPLEGVEIFIECNYYGHEYSNYTESDENGYYSINVAKGNLYLRFYYPNYFAKSIKNFSVKENEIKWLNISLTPQPKQNSIVQGHIYDKETGEPIYDALVYLHWEDNKGHEMWNSTSTDENGSYILKTSAGKIYLEVLADCYQWNITQEHNIEENKSLWINVSLEKVEVEVIIEKPYRGIYVFNRKIFPSLITIVIGKIDVKIDVYGPVWENYTEYIVDGVVKYVDYTHQHFWTWDERVFFRHELRVIVHTVTGKTLEKSIKVWIFNL